MITRPCPGAGRALLRKKLSPSTSVTFTPGFALLRELSNSATASLRASTHSVLSDIGSA